MKNLAYVVNATTEYGIAGLFDAVAEPRYFATRDNAVDHAKNLTGAKEVNGRFEGEWEPCNELFLAANGPDMERKRVVATVETVTIDEIEASL